MIHGNEVKIYVDGEPMAAATNAQVELNCSVREVQPLPGTQEDDEQEWATYVKDQIGWGLTHDGLLASYDMIGLMSSEDVTATAQVEFPGVRLIGTIHLSEVSVMADVKGVAKITAKTECDDFPTIMFT